MAGPDIKQFEVAVNDIPLATDSLSAPVIYLDAIRGLQITGETAKINLIQFRHDALKDATVAVHAATLVMPTSQIPAWAEYLGRLVKGPPFVLADAGDHPEAGPDGE